MSLFNFYAYLCHMEYGIGDFETLKETFPKLIGACDGIALLCMAGRARLDFDGQKAIVGKDCLVIIFERYMLEHVSDNFRCRYVWLHIDEPQLYYTRVSGDFWNFISFHPSLPLQGRHLSLCQAWFDRMEWILGEQTERYRSQMVKNEILNLMNAMDNAIQSRLRDRMKHGMTDPKWEIIDRLYILVQENIQKHREVGWYAAELCISQSYLNALCNKLLNMSTKAAIQEIALMHIKRLLLATDKTVAEIAQEMNYDNIPYFCRYFKKETGQSPLEFRKNERWK